MKPIPPEIDDEFTIWWRAWPRKVARGAAARAYRRARKLADAATLLAGVRAYTASLGVLRAAGKFVPEICYPATWLNGERWADEGPVQPEHEAKMIAHYRAGEIAAHAKQIAATGRAVYGCSDHEVRVMVDHGLLTAEQAIKAGYVVSAPVLI